MATTDWRMKGKWLKNCNCAYGCPCDFNAKPTNGHCEGMLCMQIDEGHFGDTDLSGVKWAAVYRWPGPLHEGNGSFQPIIDAGTTDAQRDALFAILSGQHSAEGSFFHIASLIIENILEPQIVPIDFEFDLDSRTAKVSAPGIFETLSEPIKNPVTGGDHRVQIAIPGGFEYSVAEMANASVNKGIGEIRYDWPNSHSSMAHVDQTPGGQVG